MRRSRLPRYAAVAMTALAALLVLPLSGDVAGQPAGQHGVQHASAPATVAAPATASATAAAPPAKVVTVADVTSASGGLCSVPGIGDIGGLLGFCSLGSSGLAGDLNNICEPSLPEPEPASSGIDSMVAPPATSGKQPATLYDEYGVAGDYWAATNLQCSDMTSLIGNNVAGMVFDAAKSMDRVTITVYQSAAGQGIVSWLQRVTDRLITSLGKAIYFPYLAVVVILGAIWLAWQGLIRKRGTRTIEGTIWMIVACAAALFLIGRPADVTGLGAGISNGISQALNVAFAKLPSPGPSSCVPVQKNDPEVQPATYSYTSGSTVVDQNADELWTVLVCKPWLVGEFGTSEYSTGRARPTVVNTYGRSLLWAQAIAVDEKATPGLIQAKQSAYAGIASSIQAHDPAIYPLFQGNQWTTRLEVAFAALFAAVVAGVLVLLISVTLILLKLSFLLLLIVGPFFLLIGTHPGFGRVVALRWVEMLIGVLLKQAAVALVLSVLLYCYALIMGTSDAVLPWALKILMIALVTVAAFIYRKPFQHLFSAVGYGVIGSQERAEVDLSRAGASARANTLAAATAAVPGVAAYRAARWARRNPGQAASLAVAATSAGAGAAVGAGAVAAGVQSGETASANGADPAAEAAGGAAAADGTGGRLAQRARAVAGSAASGGEPPPLRLPARSGASAASGFSPGNGAGGAVPAGSAGTATAAAGSAPGSSNGGTASGGVSAPAPGAWPFGRSASAAPQSATRRQPEVAPPRQPAGAAGSPPRARPPAQRQPRPSQRGQGQPARGQPARDQPTQRQPARGQPAQKPPRPAKSAGAEPRGSRLRARWSDTTAPPRQRPQGSGPWRSGSASAGPAAGGPASGGPASGELASGATESAGTPVSRGAETERAVPFWLRPMRRK